jgi:hypothetical protein
MLTIFLSIMGTLFFIATCAGIANIYSVPDNICYACRSAVALWFGTAAVACFILALHFQ